MSKLFFFFFPGGGSRDGRWWQRKRQRARNWMSTVSSPLAIHSSSIISLHIMGPPFDLVTVCDHWRSSVFIAVDIVPCFSQNYLASSQFPLFTVLPFYRKKAKYLYFIERDILDRRKRIWKDNKVTALLYTKITPNEWKFYMLIKRSNRT